MEDVLPPPEIQLISLDASEGQGDDFIEVDAYHDFGIAAMHITILDSQGNRSRTAMPARIRITPLYGGSFRRSRLAGHVCDRPCHCHGLHGRHRDTLDREDAGRGLALIQSIS